MQEPVKKHSDRRTTAPSISLFRALPMASTVSSVFNRSNFRISHQDLKDMSTFASISFYVLILSENVTDSEEEVWYKRFKNRLNQHQNNEQKLFVTRVSNFPVSSYRLLFVYRGKQTIIETNETNTATPSHRLFAYRS